jgi:hypothetical protein
MITKKELLKNGWKQIKYNVFTHPFFPGEKLGLKQARSAEENGKDGRKMIKPVRIQLVKSFAHPKNM